MCRYDKQKDNINLNYWFVHTLVYNKHLLFNVHGMNIKVKLIASPLLQCLYKGASMLCYTYIVWLVILMLVMVFLF
jgi:hypothetical protein